jgi:hypothetical protein
MENLFIDNGRHISPGYEAIVPELVNQLKQLRQQYGDTTGFPVKLSSPGD